MDRYSKNVRSIVMSKILGCNTAPEMMLRRTLWAHGLRGFRVHSRLPGKPDITYKSHGLAVFVDGCFWHSCPICKIAKPQSRRSYWLPKLKRNRDRDLLVSRTLRNSGWRVIRFWEHEVWSDADGCALKILKELRKLDSNYHFELSRPYADFEPKRHIWKERDSS
jgi:DNA mismatch endonuclease (patch repair protein)